MSVKPSPSCTYQPGDDTCVRQECPITCMRNYQDQAGSDIPLVSQGVKTDVPRQSWWRSLFRRRSKPRP